MPFNGSGIYTPSAADFPAVAGTLILSTKFNNTINDIATALSDCVTRDGQSPPTANLPLGGFKFVNVADGTARASPVANFASLGQVQDGGVWWAGTAGGTADALTLTMTPAIPAYVAGQRFVAKSGASPNTGAATIAVSGLAAKAIQKNGVALIAGDIQASLWYEFLYDGAAFQLQQIGAAINSAGTLSLTGTLNVIDNNFHILGSSDATKKAKFEVDGNTTGVERTHSLPDFNLTDWAGVSVAGGPAQGQILFPAVQVPSANVNTLDDYEEGSWTPIVGGTANYLVQSGTYTKIGNLVFIRGTLQINAIGTGSTSVISGLPFTSGGDAPISVAKTNALATAVVSIAAYVPSGTTSVNFLSRTAAATGDTAVALFGNGATIEFAGIYSV